MSTASTHSLRPAIWMILLAALLDMMAMGIVMPVLPGLIEGLTGSVSVLDLIVQGVLIGPVSARLGERRTMVFGLTGGALSLLAMGLAPSAIWFCVALVPSSLWGLAEPTMKSLMSQRVSEAQQGQLQGAIQTVASVAGISGPLFFGWIYASSSHTMPSISFIVAAGILVLGVVVTRASASGDRMVEKAISPGG